MIKSLLQELHRNLTGYHTIKFTSYISLVHASIIKKLCKRCRQRLHMPVN
ncbi:hypothetical protein IQ31_03484 [Sphingobacterium siyangense]|uniref:Uncharacterized protein n=1 Tax=Sphingobacterium siyangense TaxID=459529 RepID=A0A562MEF3_9SPHI|nr:hypothetical protein IQ31_03484 [Sphingobacterium siyangense]